MAARYWFQKDLNKQWLPVGVTFRRFLSDINRVWPDPGKQGLQVLQIGVSQPIEELDEPFIPVPSSPAVQSDVDFQSDDDTRSAMFCLLLLLCCNISAML